MLSDVALKWISKVIASIPPEVVVSYINDGKDPLVDAIKNFPDQVMFGKSLAKPFARILVGLDSKRILAKIKKMNPMVAGVILNHPKGEEWFEKVLKNVKDLLACDDMLCNTCLQPFPLYPPGEKKYTCPYCGTEYDFDESFEGPEE